MISRRDFIRAGLSAPLLGGANGAVRTCDGSDLQALRDALGKFQPGPIDKVQQFSRDSGKPLQRPRWSVLIQDKPACAAYSKTLWRAYDEMKVRSKKDRTDPTGLFYQGWLHWYQCSATSGDAARDDLHLTGGFLPWHRAYLYYFERLIQTLTGATDFRLAAWDWENLGVAPPVYNNPPLVPLANGCAYVRPPVDVKQRPSDLTLWIQPPDATNSQGFMGPALGGGAVSGPHDFVHVNSRARCGR